MQEKAVYISQRGNAWKISHNGNFYLMNTLGKKIFQLIVDGYSNQEILSDLLLQGYQNIDSSSIQAIRASIERRKKERTTPIRFRITIFDLKRWQTVLSKLGFLFNSYVLFIFFSVFLFLYLQQYEELRYNFYQSNISAVGILTSIIIIIFIMLFHELGHAASSLKYNVAPSEIGFGIYLYFPVLFTDVSQSWMAHRWQRIVIDLSGIYFQFILMTLFLLSNYFIDFPHYVVNAFIINNVGIAIYNLNPLFKFDGYWLFSDFFNVPNLRAKSLSALAELTYKITYLDCKNWKYSFPIYIYSVASVSFLVFVIVSFIVFLIKNVASFSLLLMHNISEFEQIFWGIVKVFLLCIGAYLSISALLKTFLTIRKNVLQLHTESK